MKGWKQILKGVSTAACLALVAVACGDNNNFQADDAPVFTIEMQGGSGGQVLLDLNLLPGRHTPQGTTLILRNSGLGDLRISRLDWVAHPERLVVDAGRIDQSCANDAECGDGAVCIQLTAGSICRSTEFPSTPFTIRPNDRRDFGFLILDGPGEVVCPAPHSEVPAEIASRYCGELRIESNDQSTSGIVQEGKARIYFLTDGRSGELRIEPSLAQFPSATAGVTQTAQITLRNNGSGELFVERADIYQNSELFEFTPSLPVTIAGNGTSLHTLRYLPPAGATASDLEFSTKMVFASSSSGRSAQELLIEVTQSTGDRPRIEVDPLNLSFTEETTQILTVRNLGNATLLLNGANFRPQGIRPYYKLFFEGNDITGSFPTGGAAPRLERIQEVRDAEGNVTETIVRSLELEVRFIPPEDGTVSTVGTLTLSHNDIASGNATQITLQGDAGDAPIGGVVPNFVTFSVQGGATSREVVVHNRGTEALDITDVVITPAANTGADDFYVTGLIGLIPAKGLLTGTIHYDGGSSNTQKNAQIRLTSNTAGDVAEMTFTVVASLTQPPTIVPTIRPSYSTDALVGQNTTFTAEDSSGNANLGNTVWALHARPAGSSAFFSGAGGQISFVPDVAGAYKVSAIVPDGDGQEVQVLFDFNAVP